MADPAVRDDTAIRGAMLTDLDTIVHFNAAMAKETESLDLPLATARAGVLAVLEGRAGAAYYLLEAPEQPSGVAPSEAGAGGGDADPPSAAGGAQNQARPKGRVIAAQLMITKEWSDWRACDIWWIQSVYVRPEHRRQGYYKALYRYVRHEAAAAGAAGLRLYADVGNDRANAAYEALGMHSHYKVYEDLFTHY